MSKNTRASNTLFLGEQFRLATIEPQSARMNVIITELDTEYYHHLEHLRRIVQGLQKRKVGQQ